MRVAVMLLAMGLAALPASGRASDALSSAAIQDQASAVVTIPFAPPIGVPLRYRLEKRVLNPEQPSSVTRDFTATFTRDGDGFRLTVEWILSPSETASEMTADERILLRPLTFRLSENSTLIGVENEAEYWAAAENAVLAEVGGTGANAEGVEGVRRLFQQMRALPDHHRMRLLGQSFLPIITMSGTEHEAGKPITASQGAETPYGPITLDFAISLVAVEGGRARISGVGTVPAAEAERMLRSAAATAGAEEAMRGFRADGLQATESYDIVLDTGLAHRFRSERTMELEIEGRRERVGVIQTITRAD